jgi:hypothetical protein
MFCKTLTERLQFENLALMWRFPVHKLLDAFPPGCLLFSTHCEGFFLVSTTILIESRATNSTAILKEIK